MAVGSRASKEVADHFCKKYGCPRAGEIISARLNSDSPPDKTEFWREVLDHLTYLAKNSPTCGIYADSCCDDQPSQPLHNDHVNDALR